MKNTCYDNPYHTFSINLNMQWSLLCKAFPVCCERKSDTLLFALAFWNLLYTPCMLWVSLQAPFSLFIYIYLLYVSLLIKKKKKKKLSYKGRCALMHGCKISITSHASFTFSPHLVDWISGLHRIG